MTFKEYLHNKWLAYFLLVFAVFFLVGFIYSKYISTSIYKVPRLNSTNITGQNQYDFNLIYVGCMSCQPSNHEKLPDAISRIKASILEKSQKYGIGFNTIGIAKDYQITSGITHLTKYGNFDEIIIGNNWSNAGILRYLLGDLQGPLATPQVLLTMRTYNSIKTTHATSQYLGVKQEKLLVRKVGVPEIISWSNNNATVSPDLIEF